MNGLKGKVICITRPRERSQVAVDMVKELGGIPLVVPTLELKMVASESLTNLCQRAGELDWIIFTSPTSLESLFKYCSNFKENLNPHCQVAVIGPHTEKVLNDFNIIADIVPEDYTAEGLLEEFHGVDLNEKKVGIPRTFKARDILPEGLKKMGATVYLAEAYQSTPPMDTSRVKSLINEIIHGKVDVVTFTSPLTVINLFEIAGDMKEELINSFKEGQVLVAAIGPITQKPLKDLGIPAITPAKYTVKNMLLHLDKELSSKE
jgi:uroporphyrinogen-III synthase